MLVEKLVREQPDLGQVFLLIKPRQGASAQQRLGQMLQLPAFEPLRQRHGPAFEAAVVAKLVAVEGDVSAEGLGIGVGAGAQLCTRSTQAVVSHDPAAALSGGMAPASSQAACPGRHCRLLLSTAVLLHGHSTSSHTWGSGWAGGEWCQAPTHAP